MNKPEQVWISVSEAYRKFRQTQTYLNRFVWSTELCYSYFIDSTRNEVGQSTPVEELFGHLPIQAWYKGRKYRGKYNLELAQHNEVVYANKINIFKSTLMLYNSFFEAYYNSRLNFHGKDPTMSWTPFMKKLNHPEFAKTAMQLDPLTVIKADICKVIRNILIHTPQEQAINITEIRNEVRTILLEGFFEKANRKALLNYSNDSLKLIIKGAINEVMDSAVTEVKKSRMLGAELSYEYFFMLYTFTNYNELAIELEQMLFHDSIEKSFYNKISIEKVKSGMEHMIATPAMKVDLMDAKTFKNLYNGKINIKEYDAFATCTNGSYYITPNLPDGIYTLVIDAAGYHSIIQTVEYSRCHPLSLSFKLAQS